MRFHPLRGLAGGVLEGGQLLDLVDGPQPARGVHEEVVGVLHEATRADRRAERIGQVGGHLQPAPVRERLPARDPDTGAGRDALRGQDLGQGPRAVTGLPGQAEVLEELDAHGQWSRCGQALALVSDEDERLLVARYRQDEDGLLETRIEARQVAEVGAVLAVGVDDQAVVAALDGPRAGALGASRVQLVRQHRHGARQAEVG